MLIIELITTVLKIFLKFFDLWATHTALERETKLARIKIYTDNILNTLTSNNYILDEQAYLASISLEKKTRYEIYRANIAPVLLAGKGIAELEQLQVSGLNFRLAKCRLKVINVLICGQNAIEKSKLISQLLIEVSLL